MESSQIPINPNPRETANKLSVLFYAYALDMFKTGYEKDIETNDLYGPLTADKSEILGDRLERAWINYSLRNQQNYKRYSFVIAVVKCFWKEIGFAGFLLAVLELAIKISQPILLGCVLSYFKAESTTTVVEVFFYATALVTINFLCVILSNHYLENALHLGMKIRIACCSLIYRKVLKLHVSCAGQTTSGQIINILSNDVSRFDLAAIFIHYMWVAPITLSIVVAIMWRTISIPGVIGVSILFTIMPLQFIIGKLSSRLRFLTASKTDERVKLMDEILNGVQVIKMYAWEKSFITLVNTARKVELKELKKSYIVKGVFMILALFTTRLAMFVTVLCMFNYNLELSAEKIFVVSAYYHLLSTSVTSIFTRGLSEMGEVWAALSRIQTFLLLDEYVGELPADDVNLDNDDDIPPIINIRNLDAKWVVSSKKNIFENINVEIPARYLVGVIGPVGSGKSTLLHLILRELTITKGSIKVEGSTSYACQDPWIFSATVRQNILFGSSYDSVKYQSVVEACALTTDFAQLPYGDMTEVGEKGASLSGGQKARINLARAVYRDADIYLLDDPLSAVDTHVGKHLFRECIQKYLKNKIVILVTHQLQYLRAVNYVLLLNDGKIEQQGTFDDVANSENEYAQLLLNNDIDDSNELAVETPTAGTSQSFIVNNESDEPIPVVDQKQIEKSSKGVVEGVLFFQYLMSAKSKILILITFLMYVLAQLTANGADYWIAYFVNQEELRNKNVTVTMSREDCGYIYAGIVVGIFTFTLLRSFTFYWICLRCSKYLHMNMFKSVIQTTMRFFNLNPGGRILNRFSKDMGIIDEMLPRSMIEACQLLLMGAGSIILASTVSPYFLIVVLFFGIIFFFVRKVYVKTSKNIKRYEGINKSPMFIHLNATMQGLTTVRSFGTEEILRKEFDQHQNVHTGTFHMALIAGTAFGTLLDFMCFIFMLVVTYGSIIINEYVPSSGADVALAITQAIGLTGILQYGFRQATEVENQLMNVERVLEYTNLKPEPNLKSDTKPPSNWPQKGHILFQDVRLRYDETEPYVLKGLSFEIKEKEKIGIVGRTGAGKSSLIGAIFRLVTIEGAIIIDGIDTKDISLQALRSKISIIPQDPVLFSGTLRTNLDPLDEHPDYILWNTLEFVELKNVFKPKGLHSTIAEHGSNYSVGQRQLLCLARAILRNNKILILDEATANVDPQTDQLIQKTIREKFSSCTVLTIAHRLNTIMDSDKILVMDDGKMVQFEHPHILCQDVQGKFFSMVEQTGYSMAHRLKDIALEAYEAKFNEEDD